MKMQRAYFKVGRDELVQMSRQGDEEAAAELIARGRDPQTGLKTSGLGARIGKAVKNPKSYTPIRAPHQHHGATLSRAHHRAQRLLSDHGIEAELSDIMPDGLGQWLAFTEEGHFVIHPKGYPEPYVERVLPFKRLGVEQRVKVGKPGARIGNAVKNPRPKRSRIRKKQRKAAIAAFRGEDISNQKFHLDRELQALLEDEEKLRKDYNAGRVPKHVYSAISAGLESDIDRLGSLLGMYGDSPYKPPKRKKAKKNPPAQALEFQEYLVIFDNMGERDFGTVKAFNRHEAEWKAKNELMPAHDLDADAVIQVIPDPDSRTYARSNGAPRLGKKYIGKYDNLCPYSGKPMLGHEVCKPFYPKGPYGRADVLEQMSAEEIKAALPGIEAAAVQRGVEKRRGSGRQMVGGTRGMRLPLALPKSMTKRERTKYDAALLPRFQNVGPEPYDEVDILRLLSRGDRHGQMTTVRFFERMLERQLSDERSGRRTRHLNQVGFNKFDAPVAEAIYEEYQSSGMTPEINAMMAEMLVKYRGQLANIASIGAQRTGRGIRTNPVDGRRTRVRRRRAGREEIAAAMMEMRGESYRRKPSEGRRHGSRGTAKTRDEMVSLYFEAYDRSPEDQTILREMGFPYPEEIEANKGIRKGHIQALLTEMEQVQLPSDSDF